MMDILISDVENENTEMKADEKNAQAQYEATMEDAKKKRAQDSKAITEKEGAKAAAEASLQQEELASTNEYLADLHNECDWLLDNFDARKAARTDEIESLAKAKAVLAGADYSLLQMSSHTHRLRR